jgi:DNA phosphorothioation-dependent restriction protein DptG
VLKLLRNVQRALKQWHALPAAERDQYKHRVDRVRSLVAELGGQQAVDYVNGAGGSPEDSKDERHIQRRQRADVIADLQAETSSLLTALAIPAAGLAKDSVPKSARIGAKLAGKGLRIAARRYSR